MAESAGLALGVISLGLEVCKGIITYADAIRNQANDLDAIEQHAKALATNLDTINNIVARLSPSQTIHAGPKISEKSIESVRQSLLLCQADLSVLKTFLVENACGCSITDPGFRSRCKDGYRVLKYGFKGKKKAEMEGRLTAVNSTLLVALKGVETDISLGHYEQLDAVQSQTNALKTALDTHSKTTEGSASEVLQKLESTMYSVQESAASIQAGMSLTNSVLGTEIQESTVTITHKMDVIQSQVEAMTIANRETNSSVMLDVLQRLERRTAFLENGNLQEQQNLVLQRLIARPSSLQSALDDMSFLQTRTIAGASGNRNQALNPREPNKLCGCQAQRISQTWMVRLGVASLSKKAVTTTRHLPSCRFSRAQRDWQDKQTTLSARVQGFKFVLDIALALSCGWSRGAGGFSISPTLSYNAVVPDSAPNFHLLSTLRDMVAYFGRLEDEEKRTLEKQMEWTISRTIDKLRTIYENGRASPRDVNVDGGNILFSYAELLSNIMVLPMKHRSRMMVMVRDWGLELIQNYGVPITPNHSGRTVLDLAWGIYGEEVIHELGIVMPKSIDGSLPCPVSREFYTRSIQDLKDLNTLRIFDMDVLTEAILKCSPLRVQNILQEAPYLAEKQAPFGRPSLFALAIDIGCAEGFITALKETKDGQKIWRKILSVRNILGCGSYAEYALSACHRVADTIQRSSDGSGNHKSPAASQQDRHGMILELLFQDRCSMRTEIYYPSSYHQPLCPDCCTVYAQEVRDRRQELKELAKTKLSPYDVESFGLENEIVLDSKTSLVISKLEDIRVEIPKHLITNDRYSSCSSTTVFHVRADVSLAIAYLQVGFTEFETMNGDGYTPLEYCVRDRNSARRRTIADWLIEQGVDLSRHISESWFSNSEYTRNFQSILCRGATMAHLLAAWVGESGAFYTSSTTHSVTLPGLVRTASLVNSLVSDLTDCICAPGGRRPYHYLFQSFFLKLVRTGYIDSPLSAAKYLKAFFLACVSIPSSPHPEIAFRLATLEMLVIPHTCSDRSADDDDLDCDENEEDELAVSLFYEITSTLQHIMRPPGEPNTGAESGGTDNIPIVSSNAVVAFPSVAVKDKWASVSLTEVSPAHQTEPKDLDTLLEDWCDKWVSEVNAALDKLYKRDVAMGKIAAAEQLGVRWHESSETMSETSEEETISELFEHVARYIDSI